MTTFISNLRILFEFLFDILGDVADFFTTNIIGMLILGLTLFVLLIDIVSVFLDKLHK